jgi:hypothetical protein
MGNGNDKGSAMQALTDKMAPTPGEGLIAQGATVQQIRTRTVTAVRCQVERDLQTVARRVVDECDECEFDPDGLIYSWTASGGGSGGRSKIEGPSIKMAMILARNWGNSETDSELVAETETHWILRGLFYDFELGSTTSRLYRQRKPKAGKGKMDRDRQEDIDFQIGQSKAIRNSVVNAMPAGIVKRAMEAARGNIKKEAADELKQKGGRQKAMTRLKAAFAKWEISIEMLEKKVGKPSKKWDADDLTALRELYQALDDGQTSAENEFETGDKKAEFGAAVAGQNGAKDAPADDEPPPPDDSDAPE